MKKISILLWLCLCGWNLSAQKNLQIAGSPNFREIGGMENIDNKKIKEQKIYRSGSFSNLSTDNLDVLAKEPIATVIDLRSDEEISEKPDHLPQAWMAKTIHAPISSINENTMKKFRVLFTEDSFTEEKVEKLMIDIYQSFIIHIADFKPVFDHFLDSEQAILFHCSAGKDRTGLISALLLNSLNFSNESIMEDFLKSNNAIEHLNTEEMTKKGLDVDQAKILMAVKPSYLLAAWKKAAEKYGSVDIMMEKELGIGSKEKEILQSKYLN